MRHAARYFLLLSVFSLRVSADPADELSPTALLTRCYAHLTQKRISSTSTEYLAVSQGADPIQTCKNLLDSTELVSSGANEGRLVTENPKTLQILRTFHNFHRTWFPRDNILNHTPGGEASPRTREIQDTTEPALHVSRALFTRNIPFSEIVKGTSMMEAIRTDSERSNLSLPDAERFLTALSQASSPSLSPLGPIDFSLVRNGDLLGVRRSRRKEASVLHASTAFPGSVPIFRADGGGMLGTSSFLLLNLGLLTNMTANGGLRMPREFPKTVMRDLFCRDLPALRVEDADPYVQSPGTANTPPFRKSPQCMACHQTMDPLASVVRNFTYVMMPRVVGNPVAFGQLYPWAVTQPREFGAVDIDDKFHQRPPNGRLVFRNYTGTLVNKSVLGIAELGRVISEQEDLYVCAASRYFEYFTGVKVGLQDPGDLSLPEFTETEREYRKIVVDLGLDFKRHGSLRTLIYKIMDLPLYRTNAMRLYQEVSKGTP